MNGHICTFSCGTFSVKSPSGKTSILFDDSDYFGPSECHPRTGDLSEISERHRWFWDGYGKWRKAGRPVISSISSPIGKICKVRFP